MAVPKSTDRLQFRQMTLQDEGLIYALFSDAEARRHYPSMGGHAECRKWIGWNRESYDVHGFGLWLLHRKDTGEFVGDCGLSMQKVENRQLLEVGYHITESQRGNGFAAEAAQAAIRYGFACTEHAECVSIVAPENLRSIRVASGIHQHSRGFHNAHGAIRLLFWTRQSEHQNEL
ncbi:GNAT family N-acetyltransferase [Qingshengfaniella alkalisoli]|uniref:GNAT family N-acetyltransferase n=1 Tax=Qingshengfaniella alkalisoli TaxID=2599296 RepID=A0A5B8IRE4_9RHOB|nr:GNAT family N-acetyltransferase [Qingshengfaniella alkalisoli]QDY68204.1 GNAT family N-acetyltransferase [Qingshengfaniella alkalisoli]